MMRSRNFWIPSGDCEGSQIRTRDCCVCNIEIDTVFQLNLFVNPTLITQKQQLLAIGIKLSIQFLNSAVQSAVAFSTEPLHPL
jgi:hypothetical protein